MPSGTGAQRLENSSAAHSIAGLVTCQLRVIHIQHLYTLLHCRLPLFAMTGYAHRR